MNSEDKARLEELKLKVWQRQAVALLQGKKEVNKITAIRIEGHKGRRPKALRLLTDNGYIRYVKDVVYKTSYGSDHKDSLYEILKFEEESAAVGIEPTLRSTWQELLYDVYAYGGGVNDDPFNQIGYEYVAGLKPEAAVYVWWHKEDYDFETDPDDGRGKVFYPKALQDTRVKAMLRAMVERVLSKTYHNRLETLLGLPKNSLPCMMERDSTINGDKYADEETILTYRNCGFTPAIFDQVHTTGLMEEYEYWAKYFAVITDVLRKFDEKVKAAGGYDVILKQMREDIIQEIMYRSPICINIRQVIEGDDEAVVRGASSRFMLKHGNFFDYDTLYGTDVSVTHIGKRDMVDTSYVSEFKPEERDSKIVSQFRKEMLDAIHERGTEGPQ